MSPNTNAPTGRKARVSVSEKAMSASERPKSLAIAVRVMTTRKKSKASSVQPRKPATTAARASVVAARAVVIGTTLQPSPALHDRETNLSLRRCGWLLPMLFSGRLPAQTAGARPAVAVLDLRFDGQHATVPEPGDTAGPPDPAREVRPAPVASGEVPPRPTRPGGEGEDPTRAGVGLGDNTS